MHKIQLRCPTCKKPSEIQYKPFCSKRCADIDLGRWFSGDYRIVSLPKNEEEEEELQKSIKEILDPDRHVG